jgi:hypothetical protein
MYSLFVFLASNWALVAAAVLAIVICGAIAWFTKNWKAAAVGVAILAAIYGVQHLFTAGVNAEVARQVAREKALLEHRIQIANEIADQHMKRAEEDAVRIEELERLAAQTPANSDACLNIDAARRVRDIN